MAGMKWTEEELRLQREAAATDDAAEQVLEKMLAHNRAIEESRRRQGELSDRRLAALQEDIAMNERIIEVERERSHSIEAQVDLHNQILEYYEDRKKLLLHEHRTTEMTVQQYLNKLRILEKEAAVEEERRENQLKYTVSVRESVDAAKDLGSQLGKMMAVYGQNQLFNYKNIMDFAKSMMSAEAGLIGFVSKLGSAGIAAFVNSVINLALQLDAAESAFRRTTGASAAMAREMTNSYEATRNSTVSLQQNQEAWGALYGAYTDFTMISQEARKEIGQTSAILTQLGVNATDSAKGMQVATKMMGQTGTQAAGTLRELSSLAENIGVAPGQLIAQYGQIGPSLSKLGADGTKAFKDLARVSKITGLEMQKLLAVTDKFDTFEGAATQAGKLNAALGGNFVNAMDLMMATDPVERFEMLRGALDEAGLSFDDMSYYQRKFYADSLGLDSVGDLAQMMSGNMEALGAETQQTSADYAEAAERAAEMASVQDSLKMVLQSLIPVLQPLLATFQTFGNWMAKHVDEIGLVVKWVGGAIIVYKGWMTATMLLQKAQVAFNATWTAFKAVLAGVQVLWRAEQKWAALKSLWTKKAIAETTLETEKEIQNDAVKKKSIVTDQLAGKTAAKTAPQMLALGVAVLLIGAGIAVAALGMAEFVKAFAGFSAGEILAIAVAIGVLTAGLYFLIPALIGLAAGAPGVAVLLALGAAVLMIGGAIALVAVGVGKMAEGVAVMFTSMDVEKVKAFSLFIATVSLAAIFLFPAAIGMLALGVGLLGVAFALKFIATDDLEAIALFSESLASIQSGQLLETAKAIRQVAKAMDDIPKKKALTFRTILERVEASANAVSRAGGAAAYGQATGGARSGGGGGGAVAASPRTNQQVTVKLELDGKLLEEKVLNIVDGKFAEAS